MQLLEQMFLKCENEMDDLSKLHALFTGLWPDLKRKCLLDRNDNHWSTYAGLRAICIKWLPLMIKTLSRMDHVPMGTAQPEMGNKMVVRGRHKQW